MVPRRPRRRVRFLDQELVEDDVDPLRAHQARRDLGRRRAEHEIAKAGVAVPHERVEIESPGVIRLGQFLGQRTRIFHVGLGEAAQPLNPARVEQTLEQDHALRLVGGGLGH